MLPIANRKTLEIPHGLAALAAVICLVLAFATDQVSSQHEQQAENGSSPSTLRHSVEETGDDDKSRQPIRDRRERHGNLSLIPWFPMPGGGRG